MKKIFYSIFILTIIFFSGCKKFLDEKPYSFISPATFPSTPDEADIALRGIYSIMQGQEDSYNGETDFFMFDYRFAVASSENCDLIEDYFIEVMRGGYVSYEMDRAPWEAFYRGINYANTAITALEKLDVNTNPWTTVKIAEAKAIRAYYYFWLVRMYSDIPLKLTPTASTSEKYNRDPAIDIYKQIVTDLKGAEEILPVKYYNAGDPADGRITKGCCKAILAQVYASMAGWRRTPAGQNIQGESSNWSLARDKAKEFLDNFEHTVYELSPDYSQLFKDLALNIYNREMIFDVPFSFDGSGDFGAGFPYIMGPGGAAGTIGGAQGGGPTVLTEWVRELETGDKRVAWNLVDFYYPQANWVRVPLADTSEWTIGKYRKVPENDDSHKWYWANYWYNFPLLRLAEVKLLYAEAINEIEGPTAAAYKQVNDIRNRAGLPNLTTGLSKQQFREKIMAERAIEFLAEGGRHFDLVRWGNYKQKMESRRLSSRMQNFGTVDEKYINVPIPEYELRHNPEWVQNK